ncbi:MAG: Rv2175c family DNA-binding protein [Rhodoglobus sp.]
MTELPDIQWLTIPDLTEILDIKVSQVRRLIEDRSLLASKIDGVWKVPASFIVDGEPMHELKGTLIVLADSGFTDEEAMRWLLNTDESLGVSPLVALRAGRKAEVRRVAQALGF